LTQPDRTGMFCDPMAYDPKTIEPKWQQYWLENETFRSELDLEKPKYYVLDMFPYPSGDGLHVGHPKGYTATDILARYKRMKGFNVLHPIGWDAFGLPAEQYAIKTGTHPRVTTKRNIDRFRQQLQSFGFSFDWTREIDTTDPGYVKWTQWIFCKLYEHGLAYRAEVAVNWCPGLGTVLANEEVIDGKSEVGGHPVERRPMLQWMLRITKFADRLLEDLEDLDWPESIKKMQREWIGRSEGARIHFPVEGSVDGDSIVVFTTRPDTLFGATYMVLAPEHPLVQKITTKEQRVAVDAYVAKSTHRSDRVRLVEKTGVFTGAYAVHPVTGDQVPIWIADYVLIGYGTGAIMAVPGHDDRDYAFATEFELPIIEVVTGGDVSRAAFTGEGAATNSGFLNDLPTSAAKQKRIDWLVEHDCGQAEVTYKLRDWLFSRQRYWGEPFPVIHRDDGEMALAPLADLPLLLPELDDFKPSGDFEPPLGRVKNWIETTDPETGRAARRDANTMPQWAGSCWYFLRFVDPHNDEVAWDQAKSDYWMPVDLYVGGAEHAVLHLLYARFWHKVFYDMGLVKTKEPFQKLVNQGMVHGRSYRYYDDNVTDKADVSTKVYASDDVTIGLDGVFADDGTELKARWVGTADLTPGPDGEPRTLAHPDLPLELVIEKMSKSRGNVLNPDDVVAELSADALRLYEMFMGPLEKAAPWSTEGIQGVARFLQRSWKLLLLDSENGQDALRELAPGDGTPEQARLVAQTIQGVTEDLEAMRFNTAISKLMVLVRDITKAAPLPENAARALVLLLSPFAPHFGEELWGKLGGSGSLAYEPWPEADPAWLVNETVTLAVQVNGKRRAEIEVPESASEDDVRAAALATEIVQRHLDGREPKRVIVVPGRLVNIVG
jgi:leucyl-tRNA synthetase